jgi:tRNA (guanosine-2'-O-)-methyltransferase
VTIARYQKILGVLHKRQPDLTILAESVHKPHNLSAMLRSCDAVGIGRVHAVNPTGGVPTYNETSASAEKWVSVEVHPDLNSALNFVRAQNMQVLAAHLSSEAVDYRDVDYTKPTCILMGNEKHGVSTEAASLADKHIIIPMLGMVQSLNVSVATAVILFEAQRQRRNAGMYAIPRLSSQMIHEEAFRLLHPEETRLYREKGLALPALAEDGSIVVNPTN